MGERLELGLVLEQVWILVDVRSVGRCCRLGSVGILVQGMVVGSVIRMDRTMRMDLTAVVQK